MGCLWAAFELPSHTLLNATPLYIKTHARSCLPIHRQDVDRHVRRLHAAQRHHRRQGVPLLHALRLVWRGAVPGAPAGPPSTALPRACLSNRLPLGCALRTAPTSGPACTRLLRCLHAPLCHPPPRVAQIEGSIEREDGTPVYKLEGRWNEYLDAGGWRGGWSGV